MEEKPLKIVKKNLQKEFAIGDLSNKNGSIYEISDEYQLQMFIWIIKAQQLWIVVHQVYIL